MKNNSLLRNAIILGLITAMGPLAIDMYLPALPSIGETLGAEGKRAMLTLTAFFVSFGVFQLIFGTLSDMYGRCGPLLTGLLLFTATSAGCALVSSIDALIALRLLQGVGGAAGMIIARAIVRDLYSDVQEVKMMSLLMLVFSVCPLLAPLTGSYVVEYFNWRAVFWVLTGLGSASLVLMLLCLSETLPKEKRIETGFASLGGAFAILIRDKSYIGMTLIGACAITMFFIFLGNSSFVMADYYGLSPRQYSLIFSLNTIAFFAAAQLNGLLAKRFGAARLILPAAIGGVTCMLTLVALVASGITALPIVIGLIFISFGFSGIIIPTISVLALADHGDIAGTAASVMNTVQLLIGAAAIAISGAFADGTPLPMAAGMAGSAVLTFGFSIWTFQFAKTKA